ncbi:MarR family winged helix-turn-helix transcriptional regulator [Micromonospora globbae]|jgi:DNA-binding MarR family transcriptional regulator|uniref:MarR family transcriptional regulator n=1 Tax=Micromonospora globbae TaxID=1894969 RepID=A0A420F588_9ACTN|nr:MarR family transcriptional regulator [Micromonospora globbae]RKF28089.1 MarR family transcriptional regulator [Micromonospora globbae]WTF87071.1 MarR family transcriptional regulator [Micromonospora globbae]
MDEPRWLDAHEDRAWRGYRRMRRLLDLELARELMRDAGLSEPDYDVLSDLSEAPEQRLRVSELADRMLWSRSRLSHHLSRMQQRGLVMREEHPSDGRGAVVVLTPEGRRAIEEAAPGHVAAVRKHLIDLLTPDELAALAAFSHRVVDHLSAPGRPSP